MRALPFLHNDPPALTRSCSCLSSVAPFQQFKAKAYRWTGRESPFCLPYFWQPLWSQRMRCLKSYPSLGVGAIRCTSKLWPLPLSVPRAQHQWSFPDFSGDRGLRANHGLPSSPGSRSLLGCFHSLKNRRCTGQCLLGLRRVSNQDPPFCCRRCRAYRQRTVLGCYFALKQKHN